MTFLIIVLGIVFGLRMIRAIYAGTDGTTYHIVIDFFMIIFFVFSMYLSLLEDELMSIVVHFLLGLGMSWFSWKLLKEDCREGENKGVEIASNITDYFDMLKKYERSIKAFILAGAICFMGVYLFKNGTEVKKQNNNPSFYDIHKYDDKQKTDNKSNNRNNGSGSTFSYDPDDYDDYGYYDDFEDFYNDHYDDFDSYEEAEDYFDSYY